MEININKQGEETLVELIGRLDTPSSQEVSNALAPVMEDAYGTIVLDCAQMTYISSSGNPQGGSRQGREGDSEKHRQRHPQCVYDDRFSEPV